MNSDTKAKFIGVYSNLPLGVRREIIAVIDEQPISWNAAFIEIKNDTEFGEKIINKLISMGIL